MTLLTEAELDEMQAVCDAAPGGRWFSVPVNGHPGEINICSDAPYVSKWGGNDFTFLFTSRPGPFVDFVLATRAELPRLIAAVRELRADVIFVHNAARTIAAERDSLERDAETMRESLASARAGRESMQAEHVRSQADLHAENERLREALEKVRWSGLLAMPPIGDSVDAITGRAVLAALAREPKPEGRCMLTATTVDGRVPAPCPACKSTWLPHYASVATGKCITCGGSGVISPKNEPKPEGG